MKILLISVGGSPEPIIQSINRLRPDKLIAFCSAESREAFIGSVLPMTFNPAIDRETILAPDIQDLVACVRALHTGVPEKLKLFNGSYEDLVVDFTGGTKTMSVALAMALCDKVGTFVYVGGLQRGKNGLGTVESGAECVLYQKNPWDELAVETLRDMAVLFNRCRFLSARDKARAAAVRSPTKKPLFQALEDVCEAFYKWDNFYYQAAQKMLRQAESKLRSVAAASNDPCLASFAGAVGESLPVLERVCRHMECLTSAKASAELTEDVDGSAIVMDLVANAIRRAELEHRYDDAVARLYSAVEKHAKLRLKAAYGIDNSDVDLAKIADEKFRGKLERECACERDGVKVVQIPLHRSFELLRVLGDQVGRAYDVCRDNLAKVLTTRNMSLLAHGFAPVTEATYSALLDIALKFLDLGREDLPRFARMGWEDGDL